MNRLARLWRRYGRWSVLEPEPKLAVEYLILTATRSGE